MPACRPAPKAPSVSTTRLTAPCASPTATASRRAAWPARLTFGREPQSLSEKFDLVLDLRATPAFTQHALPQGYFRWDGQDSRTLLQLRALVGEFEKPKFFNYKQKLCAHSRNEKIGCSACIDVCSASAISSEKSRQQIKVNANLCVGCGACTTVCPTGAISYAYPRPAEQGAKIKTLLSTYARAGGKNAALLLHSQEAGTRAARRPGPHGPARPGDPWRAGAGDAAGPVSHRIQRPGTVAVGDRLWRVAGLGADDGRRSAPVPRSRSRTDGRGAGHPRRAGLPGRTLPHP